MILSIIKVIDIALGALMLFTATTFGDFEEDERAMSFFISGLCLANVFAISAV